MKLLFAIAYIVIYSSSTLCQVDTSVKEREKSLGVNFLASKYTEEDIGVFLFQKNEQFRKDFLMEANFFGSYDLVSFGRIFHSVWDVNAKIGVGRQFENVIFDPRWLSIGMTPSLECRLNSVILQVGVDRRCHHEVDRAPEKMTTYWTQPFFIIGSKNMRRGVYMNDLFALNSSSQQSRISWLGRIGWFVKQFPGWDPSLIGGGHDYSLALTGELRYAFYRSHSWIFSLHDRTNCYVDEASKGYFTQEFEIDNTYRGKAFSMDVFLYYNLYDNQKSYKNLNKDKLGEIGFRFY